MQPFALELYKQYLSGKSVGQLATELGIPFDRIAQRIRVAAEFTSRNQPNFSKGAR